MITPKSTEMREIKFRAWGTWTSTIPIQMWYPGKCDYGITFDGQVVYLDWGGGVSELVGLTLMQYTGLKDRNGKPIYEGDWVKCEGLICRVDYVVEPGIAGFVFNQDGCGRYIEYAVEDGRAFNYEVIGNIYENPELL